VIPERVIIAVEGGAATGGAERIAFDTVKVLSKQGIPTVILSSAEKVDEVFATLPHITVEALGLPLQFERFFGGGKKFMIRNLLEDGKMKQLFSQVLAKWDSPNTVYHAHGFHNYFTQASLHVATSLKMKTIVTCHDFGITCPNATLFNYQTNEICPLKPLSLSCLQSACMGEKAGRLKQLRFARNWASHVLHHVPQKLDRILAVSDFERDILQQHFGTKATVGTLLNPVDPASTVRQDPKASKNYLWIGRMTAEKDGVTPAATCKTLGLPITFVGDGPLRSEIEAANPDATFLGWLSQEGVKQAQCSARAMILSSKWHETASLVVLECLAAGVPCVVPDTSAAISWIDDGVNGLYFQAGNQESLAKALTRLQDDEFVAQLSQNAFDRYWASPFTAERYRVDLLNVYSEVFAS